MLLHIGTIQQPSHQISWWLLWLWSQDVFLTVWIMEEHLGEYIRREGNYLWDKVCSRVYELLKMVKVFFFTVIRVFFTSLKVVSSQFQCTCYTVNVKVHTLRQSNSQGCATLWHHVRFHFPSMKLHNYCTNLFALKVIPYGWAEVHTSSLPLQVSFTHNIS